MVANLPKAKRIYIESHNKIVIYKLIKELHEEKNWNISLMCKSIGIARSAYYKWLKHTPSTREVEDIRILEKLHEISQSNNSLFGSMNMYYKLKEKYGFTCGHNRVYRIMCVNNIQSSYRKHSKCHYKAIIPEQTAENKLKRNFDAELPNTKWCTDVTEIKVPKTGEKLYISPVIDLYDRYPVGFAVSEKNNSELTDRAYKSALNAYPDSHPLYHSDRCYQYTRESFSNILKSNGMTQSMSRVSKCIDNGPCEGFQGLFKDMLFILYPCIKNKEEMIEAIYKTLDYYINEYPQKRFKGKTCGMVRAEAMTSSHPKVYPIKKSNKYIKFWQEIERKKQKALEQIK